MYADDVLILSDTPDALHASLDVLLVECSKINLKINIDKCKTLHLNSNPRICVPTVFTFNQTPISYFLEMDPITFLGKPIRFQQINDHSQIKELYEKDLKILNSFLTPRQKLDAMKTFFYPSLLYAQRTHQLPKKDWTDLDNAIRSIV